jgi:hypothetical protein
VYLVVFILFFGSVLIGLLLNCFFGFLIVYSSGGNGSNSSMDDSEDSSSDDSDNLNSDVNDVASSDSVVDSDCCASSNVDASSSDDVIPASDVGVESGSSDVDVVDSNDQASGSSDVIDITLTPAVVDITLTPAVVDKNHDFVENHDFGNLGVGAATHLGFTVTGPNGHLYSI